MRPSGQLCPMKNSTVIVFLYCSIYSNDVSCGWTFETLILFNSCGCCHRKVHHLDVVIHITRLVVNHSWRIAIILRSLSRRISMHILYGKVTTAVSAITLNCKPCQSCTTAASRSTRTVPFLSTLFRYVAKYLLVLLPRLCARLAWLHLVYLLLKRMGEYCSSKTFFWNVWHVQTLYHSQTQCGMYIAYTESSPFLY